MLSLRLAEKSEQNQLELEVPHFRKMLVQIFADEQGESHFDSVELSSNELPSIPKAQSVHVSAGQPVDNLVFMRVPTG